MRMIRGMDKVTDREFEEVFEKASDWPSAVAGLRALYAREDPTMQDPHFALLKDSALDTMLAVLSDFVVGLDASHARYTGGELRLHAPSYHVFVFRKAFQCWRTELVPPEVLADVVRKKAEMREAIEAFHKVRVLLPAELSEQMLRE